MNYICWHISPLFRPRAYVCTFFDHEYKGTSNKVMKAWDDSLIYFVLMRASLTEDTFDTFCEVLAAEQNGELLFQKPLAQITQVHTYFSVFASNLFVKVF